MKIETKVKDILIRAVKTFWQAALASAVVALLEVLNHPGGNTVKPMLVSLWVGALAAGLSALYNGFAKPLLSEGAGADEGGEDT